MTNELVLPFMLFLCGSSLLGQSRTGLAGAGKTSPVRLSETYELANIILALTDYWFLCLCFIQSGTGEALPSAEARPRDLYPVFIKRLGSQQVSLSKLFDQVCNLADQTVNDATATFVLHFSEAMDQLSSFEVIRLVEKQGRASQERLVLTDQTNV